MTLGIDSIHKELDIPLAFTEESEIDADLTCSMTCKTSYIPLVTASACHYNILSHLSVNCKGLFPYGRNLGNELGTFLFLFIMLR